MSLPSSYGSVPPTAPVVKPVTVDRIKVCVECWQETSRTVACYGRELCPACYQAEEDAYCGAQTDAWQEMDFGRLDGMISLKAIMQGMGL